MAVLGPENAPGRGVNVPGEYSPRGVVIVPRILSRREVLRPGIVSGAVTSSGGAEFVPQTQIYFLRKVPNPVPGAWTEVIDSVSIHRT
jgi:hypothetical protein